MKTEINETEYAEGFNRGYWLYSIAPDIAQSLIKNEVAENDDHNAGFSNGLKQADQEQIINEFRRFDIAEDLDQSNDLGLSFER